MAVYWITFRIREDAEFDRRYARLRNSIGMIAGRWWTEPRSFFLFESEVDIDKVAGRVDGAIDPTTDVALIGMADREMARGVGFVENNDLYRLMPFALRV